MFSLFCGLGLCAQWAVIFTGSNTWSNYRHTADSFYQYHLLVEAGIPKDHIILMNYDDIATCSSNPYSGKIYRNLDHNPNVYPGSSNIDYRTTKVTAANWYKVLKGDSSAGGKVLASTTSDYVYIFYDNHGGDGLLGVPDGCGDHIYADDLAEVLGAMKFKKCFFPITACYSGSVGKVLGNVANVYVMTASNDHESSYAALYDSSIGAYLTSEYSLYKDTFYEENPSGTIAQLFTYCKNAVTQSEVCEFGDTSIKSLKCSTFVGTLNEVRTSAKRRDTGKAPETMAAKRQFELQNLKGSLSAAQNLQMFAEKASELVLDTIIDHLKNKFVGDKNFDFTKSAENKDWAGYKKVIRCLQKNVGRLGESFWGKTFFFSNLCNIVDADKIVAEIEKLY